MSENDTCLIWGTPAKRSDHYRREGYAWIRPALVERTSWTLGLQLQ